MNNGQQLRLRLENIWQYTNLKSLFENVKRPAHTIRQNTILFSDGDPLEKLYFIQEGFIKLYRLSDEGKETTIYVCGPGDILGLRSLTSFDKCSKHNAETMTQVKVMTISHQEFFNICSTKPEYLVDLIHLYLNRLIYTETRLEAFISSDTTTRVAIFLNYCVKKFGIETTQGIVLPLALTHQLIAEFIGSVRETVTVALNRLTKEGILKTQKGKITILNPDKLKNYSK